MATAKTPIVPGPRPATFDHLQKKKPLEKVVTIYLDDDTIAAYEAAREALDSARMRASLPGAAETDLGALEENLAKAKTALDAESATIRFRSIGRKAYDRLVDQYPATPKQHEEHKAEHGTPAPYDADEFSVALIAASSVDPVLSIDQVKELRDSWNVTEYIELFTAAMVVNTQRRVVDLGKRIWLSPQLFEELSYCVPLGIPHSEFLSWDDDDQDKALGFLRAKQEICPGCGTRDAEWKEDRFAYVSDSKQCPGCELLEQERENISENAKGVKTFLVRRPPDEDEDGGN